MTGRPRSAAWWRLAPGESVIFPDTESRALHKRMALARKAGGKFSITKVSEREHRVECIESPNK